MTRITDLFDPEERRVLELALRLLKHLRDEVPESVRPSAEQLDELMERVIPHPAEAASSHTSHTSHTFHVENRVEGTVHGVVMRVGDTDDGVEVTVARGPGGHRERIDQIGFATSGDSVVVQAGGSVTVHRTRR